MYKWFMNDEFTNLAESPSQKLTAAEKFSQNAVQMQTDLEREHGSLLPPKRGVVRPIGAGRPPAVDIIHDLAANKVKVEASVRQAEAVNRTRGVVMNEEVLPEEKVGFLQRLFGKKPKSGS